MNFLATLRQSAKLALPFACVVLTVLSLTVAIYGQSEPLAIGSYELGRGIVAPEGLAKIHGRAFTTEIVRPLVRSFPLEMAGVRVWIGGRQNGLQARLRYVGFDELVIEMPPIPKTATWLLGWQRVDVEAPLGNYTGWVVVAPVSAEIFTNRCLDTASCIPGLPFGGAWVNLQRVYPTFTEPIPNHNTRIWVYGTGWRNAGRILAWIADEWGGLAAVECQVERHPMFEGWDTVSFLLPATLERNGQHVPLEGKITLQLAAQQPFPLRWWSFANAIQIEIAATD